MSNEMQIFSYGFSAFIEKWIFSQLQRLSSLRVHPPMLTLTIDQVLTEALRVPSQLKPQRHKISTDSVNIMILFSAEIPQPSPSTRWITSTVTVQPAPCSSVRALPPPLPLTISVRTQMCHHRHVLLGCVRGTNCGTQHSKKKPIQQNQTTQGAKQLGREEWWVATMETAQISPGTGCWRVGGFQLNLKFRGERIPAKALPTATLGMPWEANAMALSHTWRSGKTHLAA